MSVVGYPTPGKQKAHALVEAFCRGCGGEVAQSIPRSLRPGAAVFYGVTPQTEHLWLQARREGRDWYYIDNAYFDPCRETYFRVTRNRLQHHGAGVSDGARWANLALDVQDWRAPAANGHVLICPQSDEFMLTCARYPGNWTRDTLDALRQWTRRELRVRPWNGNKAKWYASLPQDLENCFALVTYSSASAITAMRAGVPAFVTAADCIAGPMAEINLAYIESPRRPGGRHGWLKVVADNQWTLEEMRSGRCWKMLHV